MRNKILFHSVMVGASMYTNPVMKNKLMGHHLAKSKPTITNTNPFLLL